ncbi:TIGR02996 domain-containing protein [Enhygromyxa salina]|nr:TIGR02996 domain-containing protein [Enhygromyxa salina]
MVLESNQQRLLESIYNDPRADDARRVYADWLVGRGDPRGEFMNSWPQTTTGSQWSNGSSKP